MNNVTKLPPFELKDVEAKIHELAQNSENVFIHPHAKDRMHEREILRVQVDRCLQTGRVIEGPTLDSFKQGGWKVTMEHSTAGQRVKLAAKLVEEGDGWILVITVM